MGGDGSRLFDDTVEFELSRLTQPSLRRYQKGQLDRALVAGAGEVCAFQCGGREQRESYLTGGRTGESLSNAAT